MNEAAPAEEIAASTGPKACDSEERQRVIDSIAGLLASGRPLSEILQTVKLLADRGETTHLNGIGEQNPQTLHMPGESPANRFDYEITKLPELVGSAEAYTVVRNLAGGLSSTANAIDPSGGRKSSQLDSVRGARHIALSRLFGAALFWLTPVLSAAVVGVAVKSLIDSGTVQNTAEAAANAIIGIVYAGGDQESSPAPPAKSGQSGP